MSDPPFSEVHVHDSQGIVVGDNNTVVNYISHVTAAGQVTWPHTITMSGPLESPYLGLSAFGEGDAPLFFGRENAAEEILRRLACLLRTPTPLVVSGVSGAGKSSLLRAGVLPRIGEAGFSSGPGAQPWPHLILTATGAPLAELATHVAALAGSDASVLRTQLAADPSSLALAIRQANLRAPNEPGRLVLVIDQFEQIFTQCLAESERRAFIAALHAAATIGHGPEQVPAAIVVLVVRADFEARCAEYEELADAVQDRYLLRPMTERQLRLAVTRPAEKLGSSVEPLGALAFSPDSQLLATISCGSVFAGNHACSVTLWNVTKGTRVRGPFPVDTNEAGSIEFSPDGRLLAIPDGSEVALWNTATGTLAEIPPASNSLFEGDVQLAGFSPNGHVLAAMYANGAIQLWNPATKTPLGGLLGPTTETNTNTIPSLDFSADSGLLLSMDEIDGRTVNVTPYPIWQFANPYAALCDEVGAPSASVWAQYAGTGSSTPPEPSGICAGVPPASELGG